MKTEVRGPYGPPETGPLAEMTPDQIEKLLLRAVLDNLKGGSHPPSTPMRSRCELGERLRLATGLPTSAIARFLEIPRRTWCYHRARAGRAARDDELRPLVEAAFEVCGRRGHRPVWVQLRIGGVGVTGKVVRRLMREVGRSRRASPSPCTTIGACTTGPRRGSRGASPTASGATCPARV